MKCIEISVGNTTPTDDRTMQEFAASEQAKTPFGELTIALAEETVWSAEYKFSAHVYGDDPYLLIMHPTFFRHYGTSLVFKASEDKNISVRGVEDAVHDYLWKLHEDLQPGIQQLQIAANDLDEEIHQIVVRKARVAVISSFFPEPLGMIEYLPFQTAWRDLYAFRKVKKVDDGFLYVARAIDKEFVGGVARISCTNLAWSDMRDGVQWNQRHSLFWSALAREFAIRELQIPENELAHGDVTVTEKSTKVRISQPKIDPYVVERVTFRITDDDLAIVEFGPDNQPAKAYVAASAHKRAAGLVDKHMTPSI